MDPSDLFQQANEILKERLAEAARFEGHEAYEEAQPHVQKLSAALETAQKHVAEAMNKAQAAQAEARANAAQVAAKAQAAKEAAQAGAASSAAVTKSAVLDGSAAALPFEDAQGLDPQRVQEAIHVLLRGRAKKAAADAATDDRDVAEAWSDPEIPIEAMPPVPSTEKAPAPKRRPRPAADPGTGDPENLEMELWEDLPPE